MLEALYILSALASVGGAALAIIQARKASSYAQIAESASSSVIATMSTSEVGGALERLNAASRIAAKYGPGAAASQLEGISVSDDARSIHADLQIVADTCFSLEISPAEVERIMSRVPEHTDALASSKRSDEKIRTGRELIRDIDDLTSILRAHRLNAIKTAHQ